MRQLTMASDISETFLVGICLMRLRRVLRDSEDN